MPEPAAITLANPALSARAEATLPLCRPKLPEPSRYLPLLEEMQRSGWYSNFGPLERRLAEKLASMFGLPDGCAHPAASGTAALVAAIKAVALPDRPRCLMPSWSYVATAAAARATGLEPQFADVNAETWALDPSSIATRRDLAQIGAIVVVAPFGAPLDIAAWEGVRAQTGIPVVVDAAAAFGTLCAGHGNGIQMPAGRLPTVVSLHATKTLAIGEGGLILDADPAMVAPLRAHLNFGFFGTREARWPGVNGKLSELAAAVGLAALDEWTNTSGEWVSAIQHYRTREMAFAQHGRLITPPNDVPGSTIQLLSASAAASSDAEARLASAGIQTCRWWGGGCHVQPAYQDCPADPLPVTESLGARALGLPLWRGLGSNEVDRVLHALG